MCTGAAMLSSANFTAYDSLSWLPLIILLEEDVNYFLLRVRFNFQPPTHSQLTCIVFVYGCFSRRTVLCSSKPPGYSDAKAASNERFSILYDLLQSPGTISNLPFWVSLVEQTRVEIVKPSLELTERTPPPPVTLLELRLRLTEDLWVSLWWCRVEGRDK